MTIAARARQLTKTYGSGSTMVTALDHVDFEVEAGEFTAIMGPSGSGKSTLMHLLAALDTPTSGSVMIGNTEVAKLKDTPLTELRRDRIGFIFQSFNLVPTLTARENIELPLAIAGRKVERSWFNQVIRVLGLGPRLKHKPAQLSGGQQQRVACARALMNRPDIIFGDEPTGNLDSTSAAEVLDFLRRCVDEFGQTVVMVTHDAGAASYADRQVFLSDGRIVEDLRGATQEELLQAMAQIYPRQGRNDQDRHRDDHSPAHHRDDYTLYSSSDDQSRDSYPDEYSADSYGDDYSTDSYPDEYSTDSYSYATESYRDDHSADSYQDDYQDDVYRDGGGAPAAHALTDETELERTYPRRAMAD